MVNSTEKAYKQIKIGSVISALSTIAGIFSTLLITPYLLRTIGTGDYGIYQMVAPLITSLSMLSFGLNNSLTRFLAKYRAAGDKENEEKICGMMAIVFIIIAVFALLVGTICYFFLPDFYDKLSGEDLQKAQIMFAIMVVNLGISIISQVFPAIMTAYEEFVVLNSMNLIKTIFLSAFKVILLLCGVGVYSIVIAEVTFNVIYQITIMLFCKKRLKIKLRFSSIDFGFLKELFVYSSFIFIGSIADILYWQIDKVIVGKYINNSIVSTLTIGNHFADYFIRIAGIIAGMFMMRIMTMINNKATGEQLTNAMIKLGRIQLLILGLVYSGYVVVGRQFLTYYFSAGTESEQNTAFLIGFLLLTALLIPEIEILGITILQAKNKHRFRAIVYLCIAILNVIISIPLTIKYGVIGATIGTLLSLLAGQIITMNIYYYKVIRINIFRFFKEVCRGILPAILLSIAISSLTFFVQRNTWFVLIVRALVVICVYFIFQYAIGMNQFEKGLIFSPLKKIFSKIKGIRKTSD